MRITCDLCGGRLMIDAGGRTASCEVCGMPHALARVREKIAGAASPVPRPSAPPVPPAAKEEGPAVKLPPIKDWLAAEPEELDVLADIEIEELPFPPPPGRNIGLIPSKPPFPRVTEQMKKVIPAEAPKPEPVKKRSARKRAKPQTPTIHKFVFWITNKSRYISGGRIITGKVASGTVRVGDEVLEEDTPFYHTCVSYTISEIRIQGQPVQKAYAGQQPVELIFKRVDSWSAFHNCDRLFGKEILEGAPAVDADDWNGSQEDYFAAIIERFFPEYDVLRDTAVGDMDETCTPISFVLMDDDGPALAIILCTGGNYRTRRVEDTVRACEKAHIPVQRYFKEFPNNAAFIYKRISEALNKN